MLYTYIAIKAAPSSAASRPHPLEFRAETGARDQVRRNSRPAQGPGGPASAGRWRDGTRRAILPGCRRVDNLAVVARQLRYWSEASAATILGLLEAEARAKPE